MASAADDGRGKDCREKDFVLVGREDAFASRKRHLDLRTATLLLSNSNSINPLHGTSLKRRDIMKITETIEQTDHSKTILRRAHRTIDALNNVIIIRDEVAALLPAASEVPQSKDISLILSSNPRYDNHVVKSKKSADVKRLPYPALQVKLPSTRTTKDFLVKVRQPLGVPTLWKDYICGAWNTVHHDENIESLRGERGVDSGPPDPFGEHTENVVAILGQYHKNIYDDDKAAEDKAAEDNTADDKAAEDKAAEDKTADDKAAEDKAAEDKTADDKAAEDKAAEDKTADDKTADDKAAEDKAAEDKAAEDKAAWLATLTNYIYHFGIDKVTSRVLNGSKKRNFVEVLTKNVQELDGISSANLGGLCSALPFSQGGQTNPDDPLPQSLLSVKQTTILREIISRTNERRDVLVDVYPQFATEAASHFDACSDWDSSPINNTADAPEMWYGPSARIEFHRILSSLLYFIDRLSDKLSENSSELTKLSTSLAATLRSVEKRATFSESKRAKKNQPTVAQDDTTVRLARQRLDQDLENNQNLNRNLQLAISDLCRLRKHFPEVMNSHVYWLSSILCPQSTYKPSAGYKSAESKNRLKLQADIAQGGSTLRQHATSFGASAPDAEAQPRTPDRKAEVEMPGHTPAGSRTPYTPFAKLGISSDDPASDPDDDELSRELLTSASTDRYDLALLQWLGLVCRCTDSINILAETSSETFNLDSAKIQRLIVEPLFQDREMTPIKQFLESFVCRDGRTLSKPDCDSIAYFFEKIRKCPASDKFTGTWHAETQALCLHALAKIPVEQIVDETKTAEFHAQHELELPSQEVLEFFKTLSHILPVNKRCCPVCTYVLQYVENSGKHKFLFAGAHSDWAATTLPSWTPKRVFDAVYEAVILELQERFEQIVMVNTCARSGDSGGTRSVQSSSSDDKTHSPTQQHVKGRESRKNPGLQLNPATKLAAPVQEAPTSPKRSASERNEPESPSKRRQLDY